MGVNLKVLKYLEASFRKANPNMKYHMNDHCLAMAIQLEEWFPDRAKKVSEDGPNRQKSTYEKLSVAINNCPAFTKTGSDQKFEYNLWHTRLIILSFINFYEHVPDDFVSTLLDIDDCCKLIHSSFPEREFQLIPLVLSYTEQEYDPSCLSENYDPKKEIHFEPQYGEEVGFNTFLMTMDLNSPRAKVLLIELSTTYHLGAKSIKLYVDIFSSVVNTSPSLTGHSVTINHFKYLLSDKTPIQLRTLFEQSFREFVNAKLDSYIFNLKIADDSISSDNDLNPYVKYFFKSGFKMREALLNDLEVFKDSLLR